MENNTLHYSYPIQADYELREQQPPVKAKPPFMVMEKMESLRLYSSAVVRVQDSATGVYYCPTTAAVSALGCSRVTSQDHVMQGSSTADNRRGQGGSVTINGHTTGNIGQLQTSKRTGTTQRGPNGNQSPSPTNNGGGRGSPDGHGHKAIPIEIIQINLQKSKSATAVLQQSLIEVAGPAIALMQEPYTYKDRVCGMGSTDCIVHSDANHGRPRAAIVCSKQLNAVSMPQFCSRDVVAIQLQLELGRKGKGKQTAIMASAYLPYEEKEIPSQELVKLIDHCKRENILLLIGLDANAHHVVWGSTDNNARGYKMLEFLGSKSLDILNQGDDPTFVIARRQEVIDITVASGELTQHVENWRVSKEISMSDHRHIRFRILTREPKLKLYRNPKKTNWEVYESELNKCLQRVEINIKDTGSLDAITEHIEWSVMSAFKKACPVKRESRRTGAPWWTGSHKPKLTELRKLCRKSLRTALSRKTEENWDQHKEYKHEFQKLIRKSKRESWRSFCQDIESVPDMARLSKILKGTPRVNVGMLEKSDGQMTFTDKDAVETLLKEHFPGCVIGEEIVQTRTLTNPTTAAWTLGNRLFSNERVRYAVSQLTPYKAPGIDGIWPILLQKGAELLLPYLVDIYKNSLAFGYIPKKWRRSSVCFLPKPGKSSYKEAKSFRPISLSSFVLKTMEKVIDRYMKEKWLVSRPIHEHQHAYLTGRSTETAIHAVVGRIETTLEHKQYAVACLVDIAGAFNNCRHRDIRHSLWRHGIPMVLTNWAVALLSQRDVEARVGDSTCIARTKCGTAQGGVLSATFWILVIDSLLEELNNEHFWAHGYSDDIIIILKGLDPGVLCERMESALRLIDRWCDVHGLTVNPKKTEAIVFTKNRKLGGLRPLKLKGETIDFSPTVKYLGVFLDSKLTFKYHIEQKCNKAMKMFWLYRGAIGKTYGVKPSTANWFYRVIVLPTLTHGAIGWWQGVQMETMKSKLSKVQRLALISITGAMRTTPTAAMEAIMGFPPLDTYIEKIAMATAYRFSQYGRAPSRWAAKLGHNAIWERLKNRIPTSQMPSDVCAPRYRFSQGFSTRFPLREEWANGQIDERTGILNIYTDGSRCEGAHEDRSIMSSGSGAFSTELGIELSYPIGRYGTVFQAEVVAIKCALECVIAHTTQRGPLNIHSDSQAAIRALSAPRITSKIVFECRKLLEQVACDHETTLVWVPGHMGIELNEKADWLAQVAARTRLQGPEPMIGIPPATVKLEIAEWARKKHEETWRSNLLCRQSHEFMPNLALKIVNKKLLGLSKIDLRFLIGLLTGHTGVNYMLHKMGLVDTPRCELCNLEDESVRHLLEVCPALMQMRRRAYGREILTLEEVKAAGLSKMLTFAKKTGRFT